MLMYAELVSLARALRDERVLSIYLDGTAEDPAAKRVWRVELNHALKDIRRRLAGSSAHERTQFERCVALLEEQLSRFDGAVGAPGWAAFITSDGVRDAERLPVQMKTSAVWGTGMCIAPYVRALKQTRLVVIVVGDARKAAIYSYRAGVLTLVETVRAHVTKGPPSHMGDAPRVGFHPGVRGTSGHDAAQRALGEGTDRMLDEVSRRAVQLAGADGWILTGGTPEVSGQAARSIARLSAGRVRRIESLDVHATEADIAIAAQRGASTLRDEWDGRRVDELIEHEEQRNGAVAVGPDATRRSLAQSCVRELYLTTRFLEDHPADAEDAVRAALDQGALVEEVVRDVAARLDAHGGVAARLRYRRPETTNTPAEAVAQR